MQPACDETSHQRHFISTVGLERDLLALTQEVCSAAFKGSPMKRATLRGVAAVVLDSTGDAQPALGAVIPSG